MTKVAKKYRELSIPELKEKVKSLKENYSKEIVKTKTGANKEKAFNLKKAKQEIATVLTIIREKEIKNDLDVISKKLNENVKKK
jgi:ribosomal protein L29